MTGDFKMKKFKVGLQLYSVRDKMEQDMEKTLMAVKEMGYDCVEFAGYFGKSAEEVKNLLDKIGLECISVHQGYDVFLSEPQKNVEYIKNIGAKYCAIPWMGIEKHKGSPDFDKAVAEIVKVAKLLKENSIQMLYHNHDFEFTKYEDKYLFDWLYETVGLDLLKPEIDTCWVKYAGEDPCKYLEKYSGHINVVHLKDFTCRELGGGPVYALIDDSGKEITSNKQRKDNEFKFSYLGSGMQNFKEILESAEKGGTEYVIVEQDQWYKDDSLELARKSREHLKSLGI